MSEDYAILLTIDVEDWFQVENFKQWIPFSSWSSRELRVEENTHRLLDLLDSQRSAVRRRTTDNGRNAKAHATFFILGWLARRLPNLVREIHSRGHEVASHGYLHNRCNNQSQEELKKDLRDSKNLLEDIIGASVYGYRAPSFSINHDILKIIRDCGYLYDSSYNSFGMHSRYGRLNLSQSGTTDIAQQISNSFYELAISNIRLGNRTLRPLQSVQSCSRSMKAKILTAGILSVFGGSKSESEAEIEQKGMFWKGLTLPWGGGAYFRLMPFPLFKLGVQSILKQQKAYLFYLHPWELDPEQPRVVDASTLFKFRHYVNLNKTSSKLSSLIETFKAYPFVTCSEYLMNHKEPGNPVE
jgi:polysaccharide deacetylase family protein (PEP-CTERM system associated)